MHDRKNEHGQGAEARARVEAMYKDYRQEFPEVAEVDPQELLDGRSLDSVVFVDEREPGEQAVSMLPGAITADALRADPNAYAGKTLIGYCTISYRSGLLAREMAKRGVKMLNLRGGLLGWVHAGGKVYDANGETRRIHVYGSRWNYPPPGYETVW